MNQDQTRASTYVGVALAIGIVGLVAYAVTGSDPALAVGVLGVTMMLPLGSMFTRGKGKKRLFLVGYTILMLVVGCVGIFLTFALGTVDHVVAVGYAILFAAYTWIANFIGTKGD